MSYNKIKDDNTTVSDELNSISFLQRDLAAPKENKNLFNPDTSILPPIKANKSIRYNSPNINKKYYHKDVKKEDSNDYFSEDQKMVGAEDMMDRSSDAAIAGEDIITSSVPLAENTIDGVDKFSQFLNYNISNNPESRSRHSHGSHHNYESINYKGDLSNRKIVDMNELLGLNFTDLSARAQSYNITQIGRMPKQEVVFALLKQAAYQGEIIKAEGVLEVLPDGFGFLRSSKNNYFSSVTDIYVSQNQIKKFHLRPGDEVQGYVKDPRKNSEKFFSIVEIITINGQDANDLKNKINFDNLTPVYPDKKINLDVNIGKTNDVSTRIIDIVAPLGLGQRALIVAPPRSGKTVLLQNIAHAININHPEVSLIVLLIDERPEEVTDMMRSVKGEVISSTFDEPAHRHVVLAEIVCAKAKRMVESGKHVLILLDSITRLARAYNTVVPSSGKVLTGGVDANALQKAKRFFGAARNTENGGSLTIIATALVDTGSKMDDVIFEEFKGTGNSEIILDRKLSDRRLFPAIDPIKSGTRNEEKLIGADALPKRWMLRKILDQIVSQVGNNSEALDFLLQKVKETKNNIELFVKMNN